MATLQRARPTRDAPSASPTIPPEVAAVDKEIARNNRAVSVTEAKRAEAAAACAVLLESDAHPDEIDSAERVARHVGYELRQLIARRAALAEQRKNLIEAARAAEVERCMAAAIDAGAEVADAAPGMAEKMARYLQAVNALQRAGGARQALQLPGLPMTLISFAGRNSAGFEGTEPNPPLEAFVWNIRNLQRKKAAS